MSFDPDEWIYPPASEHAMWVNCPQCQKDRLEVTGPKDITLPRMCKPCLWPQTQDWIVTLPRTTEWLEYKKELLAAESGAFLNYRVNETKAAAGDRLWLVWRGRVRGWMEISGKKYWREGFTCLSTGQKWPPGVYIQRSGRFHYVKGDLMKGFMGIRRYTPTSAHAAVEKLKLTGLK